VSYCRWSSDDFQSDVYVYEDVRGGWTTHVANRRVAYLEPLPPPVETVRGDTASPDAWLERHQIVTAMRDAAELVPIGLPHDGDNFNDGTPGECADRLESLRALGYNVPQYAIDTLREEAAEAGSETT
jgi:hypothetical protein